MLRGQNPTFAGNWYRVENALNNPRLRPTIPIMIGGGGEHKTFALAARFADHLNIICNRQDIPRKVGALRQRCEETGRDPATLATSYLAFVLMVESGDQARAALDRVSPEQRDRIFAGTPDQVAEDLQKDVLDQGIGGLTINLVLNGHQPGIIAMAGQALRPLVG
jgi:alkanesulfonate monooxygenase SsuD/methylene tetrahydromethanopterin reductase-like flavin-dependent oxidoreductase (luciferase family)